MSDITIARPNRLETRNASRFFDQDEIFGAPTINLVVGTPFISGPIYLAGMISGIIYITTNQAVGGRVDIAFRYLDPETGLALGGANQDASPTPSSSTGTGAPKTIQLAFGWTQAPPGLDIPILFALTLTATVANATVGPLIMWWSAVTMGEM